MEGNLGDSEKPSDQESVGRDIVPPMLHPIGAGLSGKTRSKGRGRAMLPWVLGGLGVLLVLWGVSAVIERMARQPGVGGSSGLQPVAELPAGATAHIEVKVLDDQGRDFAVGTQLPRQYFLGIRDAAGQEYSVPFDRVGVWAVNAPDGEYAIPEEQKGLGNWSWKMTGDGVKKDGKTGGWVVSIGKAGKPVALGITLY